MRQPIGTVLDFTRSPAGLVLAVALVGIAAVDGIVLLAWTSPPLAWWPTGVDAGRVRWYLAVAAPLVTGVTLSVGVLDGHLPRSAVVVGTLLALAHALTGVVLQWNQLSWAVYTGVLDVPVVGEPLGVLLFGTVEASAATLRATLRRHVALTLVGLSVPAASLVALVRDRRRETRA